jgi:hypothetical protein
VKRRTAASGKLPRLKSSIARHFIFEPLSSWKHYPSPL